MTLHATFHPYTLHFKKPAGTSRGALLHKETWFLCLRDPAEPNRLGVGECSPQPGLSRDDLPQLPQKLADVCEQINRGRPLEQIDLRGWPAVQTALDLARQDWQTGGQQHLYDSAFARGEVSLPIHGLIWMGSPAEVLAQVQQKVKAGVPVIKMKVGALPFADELALLAEIRRVAPRHELRLDANGAFSIDEALAKLKALAAFDVHSLEQPIKPGQVAALANLCAASPIPIALDEELLTLTTPDAQRDLLTTVRPAYLVLKPTLLGGQAATEQWIALANAQGIGWWFNSMLESNVGLNALAQWAAHLPSTHVHGLGTGQLFQNNIPSPLQLDGAALRYNFEHTWDFSVFQEAA